MQDDQNDGDGVVQPSAGGVPPMSMQDAVLEAAKYRSGVNLSTRPSEALTVLCESQQTLLIAIETLENRNGHHDQEQIENFRAELARVSAAVEVLRDYEARIWAIEIVCLFVDGAEKSVLEDLLKLACLRMGGIPVPDLVDDGSFNFEDWTDWFWLLRVPDGEPHDVETKGGCYIETYGKCAGVKLIGWQGICVWVPLASLSGVSWDEQGVVTRVGDFCDLAGLGVHRDDLERALRGKLPRGADSQGGNCPWEAE